MKKEAIEIIKIEGFDGVYHLARNIDIWRKEVKERWHNRDGEAHHIAGRYGILARLIENGIIIPHSLHAKEKSIDIKERIEFKKKIKEEIDLRYGKDLFINLMKIRDILRYNPKGLKWEAING